MNQEKPKFIEDYHVEQSPEEILKTLEDVAELGMWAKLTVAGLGEDNNLSTQEVLPIQIDGAYLVLETEGGKGMSIELNRIKMVQLPNIEFPKKPAE